jgi:hypothetical protein
VKGPFRGFSARVERIDSRIGLSVGTEIFGSITPSEIEESDIEAVEAGRAEMTASSVPSGQGHHDASNASGQGLPRPLRR